MHESILYINTWYAYTSSGFNYNLVGDILCGIQATMCLYLMITETG